VSAARSKRHTRATKRGSNGSAEGRWSSLRGRAQAVPRAAPGIPHQRAIRIFLQGPKEDITLKPGETYTVAPRRPHLVTNAGEASATFLVLQGIGEYDFIPLLAERSA